jgi:DNA gyrase inhibitor GyrI
MYDPYYSDDEDDSSDEVKKLISMIEENNLVDKEDINIYSDHIEIYSINGCDSEYFMENFIRLYPDDIDNGFIRVDGENYEEEIDDEEYQEVLDYIFENWEPLLDIEFIV